jgi:phage tail-like protein
MSCCQTRANFRLLDAYVGWDTDKSEFLTSVDDPTGLRLAPVSADGIDVSSVLGRFPPPRLAAGCHCEWYLVTPPAPKSRWLRRGPCDGGAWQAVWCSCDPNLLVNAVAIASRRHFVAISDHGAKRVWVWANDGDRVALELAAEQPGPLTFTTSCELWVVKESEHRVVRWGLDGRIHGMLPVPAGHIVERIACGSDQMVWLLAKKGSAFHLWRAARDAKQFEPATPDQAIAHLPLTGVYASASQGFCLQDRADDGSLVTRCYSWYGRDLGADLMPPGGAVLQTHGQLLTLPIDSGIPRCRWHRVRVDADVPAGTAVEVTVATSETAAPKAQGRAANDDWGTFAAGVPHPEDWQQLPAGARDFLVQQPAGRYLFLRLRLTGNGTATPVVRRVRLDFPRSTSLEHLPSVYRENQQAEDFTERFLSLVDAQMETLDRAIERYPALLDAGSDPDEVLPWLASFFDVVLDNSWTPQQSRQILRAIPKLYCLRGTPAGLRREIQLVFGVSPTIQEFPAGRSWGAVGKSARVGMVRLFGKAAARFRLGRSRLDQAPLHSYGNPDQDALTAESYRFRVLAPPFTLPGGSELQRLRQLIATQKPAHTAESVRIGAGNFVLGFWSTVGVDTALAPLPRPVLGQNTRLNRMSVVAPGPYGARYGVGVGRTTVVGSGTGVKT